MEAQKTAACRHNKFIPKKKRSFSLIKVRTNVKAGADTDTKQHAESHVIKIIIPAGLF